MEERKRDYMLRLQLLRDIAAAKERVVNAAKELRMANAAWLQISEHRGEGEAAQAAYILARTWWTEADKEFIDAVDALTALEQQKRVSDGEQ
jgi:23S rRNA maturation-related 3'-5' exoribonuclease YhaM